MLTYTLLAGLLFGLYFTLIGLGLNLVFGVMRLVNLVHGGFLMLGAFLAVWLVTLSVLFVYLYLYQTRLGYLTRAVMVNREEAIATGIDVHRVSAIAFGVGLALAAVAGVFAPFMLGSITPAMGVDVTVTSFTVIVIGSLGNPLGTVLGGLIYGVSYMFMQSYFSSWANLLPYLLLIAILLVRPSGLLGRQVRRA